MLKYIYTYLIFNIVLQIINKLQNIYIYIYISIDSLLDNKIYIFTIVI